MIDKSLRFLIISDLHAHDGDPKSNSDSYYSTSSLFSSYTENPLSGITELLSGMKGTLDWVVCPGDLGDKADPIAQEAAWTKLEIIRSELNAKLLIGSSGNHDLDSFRARPDFDPKSTLQKLFPKFPISTDCFSSEDSVYADRFWSNNFVLVPFADFDCNLLLINSCAFHGYSSDVNLPPDEHRHGKLSSLTLNAIKTALSSSHTRLNIALVHHHPRKHPWIDDAGSVMAGGDKLIEFLKSTEKQWLIIHGHQHVPHLSYADASPFAPIVLSAASVAAKTYPVKGEYPRNQIHLVEIPVALIDAAGERVLGTVTSWTWAAEIGWQEAGHARGLPFKAGFGHRTDLITLRDAVCAAVGATSHGVLAWAKLVEVDPKISYLVPDDQAGLISLLQKKGITATYSESGLPTNLEIAK